MNCSASSRQEGNLLESSAANSFAEASPWWLHKGNACSLGEMQHQGLCSALLWGCLDQICSLSSFISCRVNCSCLLHSVCLFCDCRYLRIRFCLWIRPLQGFWSLLYECRSCRVTTITWKSDAKKRKKIKSQPLDLHGWILAHSEKVQPLRCQKEAPALLLIILLWEGRRAFLWKGLALSLPRIILHQPHFVSCPLILKGILATSCCRWRFLLTSGSVSIIALEMLWHSLLEHLGLGGSWWRGKQRSALTECHSWLSIAFCVRGREQEESMRHSYESTKCSEDSFLLERILRSSSFFFLFPFFSLSALSAPYLLCLSLFLSLTFNMHCNFCLILCST